MSINPLHYYDGVLNSVSNTNDFTKKYNIIATPFLHDGSLNTIFNKYDFKIESNQ